MKKLQVTNHKLQLNKGVTLFIAVVIMSILLFISFAVVNIAIKSTTFATFGRDSQLAFYAADAGLDCAIYWDSKYEPSRFTIPGSSIDCGGYTITDGNNIQGTTTVAAIGVGGTSSSDVIWFDDSLPAGSSSGGGSGTFPFSWQGSSPPGPNSGSLYSILPDSTGNHQSYFTGASTGLQVNTGDNMIVSVYLDPAYPPSELMLQWNNGIGADGGWAHRAYWGNNSINWGIDGTDSRRYMGPLPLLGGWRRLVIPASQLGLEGTTVTGFAFTLYDGRGYVDRVGKSTSSGGTVANSVFGFVLDKGVNPTQACAIVSVTKNPSGTTFIRSRGYNTCDLNSNRRIERGVEVTY
jgi:hypothetical protein